ncbi:unnamed protein product, partial [Mesorhabditis belari]|uniref:Uncharacterized protein n=1 Tax=Mesorhabditis belari TaxID=2138241 RepID=A0AAF3J7R8_9BILA
MYHRICIGDLNTNSIKKLKYCGETSIDIFARDLYNLMSNGWQNSTNGKIFKPSWRRKPEKKTNAKSGETTTDTECEPFTQKKPFLSRIESIEKECHKKSSAGKRPPKQRKLGSDEEKTIFENENQDAEPARASKRKNIGPMEAMKRLEKKRNRRKRREIEKTQEGCEVEKVESTDQTDKTNANENRESGSEDGSRGGKREKTKVTSKQEPPLTLEQRNAQSSLTTERTEKTEDKEKEQSEKTVEAQPKAGKTFIRSVFFFQ